MRSTQSRSGLLIRSDSILTLRSTIDDHAGGGVAGPEAQVVDGGEAGGGRRGEGGRLLGGTLLDRRLHGPRPGGVGEGVDVVLAGLEQPLLVAAGLGHLEDGVERRLRVAAARILVGQGLVGAGRVALQGRLLEALGHGPEEVAHGEQGVVAVAALGVAGHELAVAGDDLVPLRTGGLEAGRGLQGRTRLLGFREEGRVRSHGGLRFAGLGRAPGRASGGGAHLRSGEDEPRGQEAVR